MAGLSQSDRADRQRTRRQPFWIAARHTAVAGLLILIVGASPAQGHTNLAGSSPAAGARLGTAPAEISLRFTEEISAEFAQASLSRGEAPPQRLKVAVSGPVLTAGVPPQEAGEEAKKVAWMVSYRVVSADGHPITGTVQFAAPSGAQLARTPSSTATASPKSGTGTDGSEADSSGNRDTATDAGGAGSTGSAKTMAAVGGAALAATVAAVILAVRRRSQRPQA